MSSPTLRVPFSIIKPHYFPALQTCQVAKFVDNCLYPNHFLDPPAVAMSSQFYTHIETYTHVHILTHARAHTNSRTCTY